MIKEEINKLANRCKILGIEHSVIGENAILVGGEEDKKEFIFIKDKRRASITRKKCLGIEVRHGIDGGYVVLCKVEENITEIPKQEMKWHPEDRIDLYDVFNYHMERIAQNVVWFNANSSRAFVLQYNKDKDIKFIDCLTSGIMDFNGNWLTEQLPAYDFGIEMYLARLAISNHVASIIGTALKRNDNFANIEVLLNTLRCDLADSVKEIKYYGRPTLRWCIQENKCGDALSILVFIYDRESEVKDGKTKHRCCAIHIDESGKITRLR